MGHHDRSMESRLRLDQAYKRTILNPRVLVLHLKMLQPFRDTSPDEVVSCLEIGPGGSVVANSSEIISYKVPVILVGSFRLRIPGKKRDSIVFTEGQNKFYGSEHLMGRIIFYGGRTIGSQKNVDFANDDYEDLKEVYGVCLLFNPPANLGTGCSC